MMRLYKKKEHLDLKAGPPAPHDPARHAAHMTKKGIVCDGINPSCKWLIRKIAVFTKLVIKSFYTQQALEEIRHSTSKVINYLKC